MAKLSKEEKEKAKKVIQQRNDITKKIAELDKSIKHKSESDLKTLIKLCKEFENHTNTLKGYGYKVEIWHKRLDYRNWEAQLLEKTSIKSVNKKNKTTKKSKATSSPVVEPITSNSLYYVMLCWTTKANYCVCDSLIENIQKYFTKMKLEFMDTMTNEFPDRIEYCSTYKLKSSSEVYNTIINSAEYIIEIQSNSAYESCNIAVFGKKIE